MKRKTEEQNIDVFFSLLRAGLWSNANLDLNVDYDGVDWGEVYRLAEEQSVVGLIADGIDRFKLQVPRFKVPQEWALQFIGATLQLEQRNKAMNQFIGELIQRMRKADIYTLMVKGQAVAQCYEKPLWRACGDVDFFLDDKNYKAAQDFLMPLAASVDTEGAYSKHIGMAIDPWEVELHGTMRCGLSSRMDKGLDELQEECFKMGAVRVWKNGETDVYLPSADNDIIFVFTHFLKHFYKGGIGLRQICDWCRLLWTYREEINTSLLERRLREMGLATTWKAFGMFAILNLGMPKDAMPLLKDSNNENGWKLSGDLKRKAKRIQKFIMESGNFGHSRDNSYFSKYPYIVRKCFSMGRRVGDLMRHSLIFPMDSMRYMPKILVNGLRSAANGE